MKILFTIALLFTLSSYGQNTQEWIRQNDTQIKYLLDQIAANKVYLDYLQAGYGIARKGLNTIERIKDADLNLHTEFIGSLSKVNPRIRSYVRVADIITCQLQIIKRIKSTLLYLKESHQFTGNELEFNSRVLERLRQECLKSIDNLVMIITSNELMLTDDERIKRIDQVYVDMQEKYAFCDSFSKECSMLALQRFSEQVEISLNKVINGIK